MAGFVHNLSLPTQRKACREYCERQGLTVAHEFIEEGDAAGQAREEGDASGRARADTH